MNLRVVVADDDEDSLVVLGEALEACGFDVRAAHSCAEARALLGASDADVLVTDLSLRDGSGLELLRALGPSRPRVAVLVTGYGSPEDRAASKAAGFQAHLLKPVALEQLARTLRVALGKT